MSTREQQAFNEDGTPRRRYELEEREESKAGLRAVIGLVLANGFILLKNVLMGEEAQAWPAATAKEKNGHVEDEPSLTEVALADTGEGNAAEQEPPAPAGSGSLLDLFASREPFYPEEPEPIEIQVTRSQLPAPVNDNESLYGAPPGSGLDLTRGDIGAAPGSSGPGAGGSSPPPADGSDEPPGGDNGDDDRDENEDDNDDNEAPRTNRLPVVTAPVILADLVSNHSIVIALSQLLQNATDPDGDPLVVENLTSSSGTLVVRSDGNWLFTPETDDISEVTFSYQISDGEGEVAQTALLDLVPQEMSRIIGTAAGETLIGTPRGDLIDGLGGDDQILGREGDDEIHGGEGNDRIIADDGDDVIFAGPGDDVVFAGAGNDVVFGGEGDDQLFGEDGNDRLFGEEGNDWIDGGRGNDLIVGGSGMNRLYGKDGNDVIEGGEHEDEIDGGEGDDTVFAGAGNDLVHGGTGNDLITGNDGDDALYGDEGDDVLDGNSGDDIISGGVGNDTITGGAGADIADGGAGDDVFVACVDDGNDVYDGGEDCDTYDASAGSADAAIDLLAGTATSSDIGTDALIGIENAIGGAGNDTLVASEAVNILSGGEGNDVFVFRSAKAAGKGKGGRDKILDFEVGDRIDLDDISEEFADEFEDTFKEQGIRRFVLIEQQEAFSKPGQMKFKYDTIDEKEVTVVQGNIDYDPEADFEIELVGHHELKSSDFYGAG